MIVSKHKKQNDIAGYVLYMWQIEDLIRANDLDMAKIEKTVISQYEQPGDVKQELRDWYGNLVAMMKNEKKEGSRSSASHHQHGE
ncbi:DUF4924 family protein [Anaerophaga thermohalophila]|uniref:DUF4924 family protein n=1 Tax=Anaerophaga thermohalophila TaxID=177400 RepID=UPI0002D32A3C|nr:DUF4924 family protein [Anaerophaga thermohalophila]